MLNAKKDYDGITFSDSEDDCDNTDEVREQVSFRLQENTSNIFRAFKDFLSEPAFINNKGDDTTNIVDRHQGKCYCIPDRKIPKFMKFLEIFRRQKLKTMLYEKQQKYSGIMLDFDIKVNHGGESQISHTHYHRLCIMVIRLLLKYVHFTDEETKVIHIGFTKKPKVVFNNEGGYYKDGIHMLIPGIQITREFKRFIIDTIESEGLLEKVFKEIAPHESNTRADFLDTNSAHVGVFFVGSASKINTPAYSLDMVYNVQVTINEPDDIMPMRSTQFNNSLTDPDGANVCYEFSLNYQKNPDKGGIIDKKKYDIKTEYATALSRYIGKTKDVEDVEEDDKVYGEMSLLNMHDADTSHIKLLLDTLHPKRSEEYALWFNVICALAHSNESYKVLGEYFSQKSPEKFDQVKFDQVWSSIIAKKSNKLSMGSIHYWAKCDNPDKYMEVMHRSLYNVVYKKIYDRATEGVLGHYDLAQILYTTLKDKYVYDHYDDEGGSWYEFIIENEPRLPGELYKWRKYDSQTPASFLRYISEILPNLFSKILDRIKTSLDESSEELAKYHNLIYNNFKRSCRNLKDSSFKSSVAREAKQLFEKIGFAKTLDSDPNLKGVGNGILQLSKKCHLITGFHGHRVSKYTEAKYKDFNPHDPTTKKVIMALRNLFPDHEPDTFEYIMHYLASTLDGNKKESIFLLLVGKGSNGKSCLVELHKGAIGSVHGVKMPLSFLTSRSKDAESATPALMQLKDATFAYYSESNKFEVLNMAKIKEFTGQETLAGRKLHQDYINFKPKCHHLVASNNDFEVHGTDHGTWRRIDYVPMKIKFCNPATDEYDPKNPFERLADPDLGSKWPEDEDVLASYLGVLTYYYESLHNKYKGKVRNVPHPHIIRETEEFRSRQDRVNNFLNNSLVKSADTEYEMPITTVREIYIKWYEEQYPGSNKEYQRVAIDQLENSKIQTFIKKSKRGNFLKGYRVLDTTEEKNDDEEYYTDVFETSAKDVLKIKKESAQELHARLCDEYDSNNKHKEKINDASFNAQIHNNVQNTDDTDSDIDDIVEDTKKREPKNNIIRRGDKLVATNLDTNGIKVPRKKVHNPTIAADKVSIANMKRNLDPDSESDSD